MARPSQKRGPGFARLPRIEFPRMKVEDGRCTSGTIGPRQQPSAQRVRIESEKAASRSRDIDPEQANCGERHFDQSRKRRKGGARRAGAAVKVVLYRVDAGTVLKAFFGQNGVSPSAAAADREGGRPIAA